MITLRRLNGSDIVLNAELIECLEPRGAETLISLATGNHYAVAETAEQITEKIVEYRRKVGAAGKTVNPIQGFTRENP